MSIKDFFRPATETEVQELVSDMLGALELFGVDKSEFLIDQVTRTDRNIKSGRLLKTRDRVTRRGKVVELLIDHGYIPTHRRDYLVGSAGFEAQFKTWLETGVITK